jgi:hypothetical protein
MSLLLRNSSGLHRNHSRLHRNYFGLSWNYSLSHISSHDVSEYYQNHLKHRDPLNVLPDSSRTLHVTPQNWHLVNYSNHATICTMSLWKRTTKRLVHMQHARDVGGIKVVTLHKFTIELTKKI